MRNCPKCGHPTCFSEEGDYCPKCRHGLVTVWGKEYQGAINNDSV